MLKLTFLGTSSGIPTKKRNHPSIVLQYEGDVILWDCGEGTQRQLQIAKISPMKISKIFITHWHADHYAGLLALPQTLMLLNREEPIEIYGPENAKKVVQTLIDLATFEIPFDIKVNEIKAKKVKTVLKEKSYAIKAVNVLHSIPTLAYSFEEMPKRKIKREMMNKIPPRLRSKLVKGGDVIVKGKTFRATKCTELIPGKKIVYSSDTGFCDALISLAKNADLLIHEATFAEDKKEFAKEVLHSTARQAAQVAKRAKVKELLLMHLSARYKEADVLLEQAKKEFQNVRIAEDFMKLKIK